MNTIRIACLALVCCLSTDPVLAETLDQAEKALLAKQDALLDLQRTQLELETRLNEYDARLPELQQQLKPLQTALDEARSALNQAKAQFELDASAKNQARMDNAEFKYFLSERKFNQADAELTELKQLRSNTQTELDKNRSRQQADGSAIDTLRKRLQELAAKEKLAAEKRRQQQLAAQKRAAEERARTEAELARSQAENARLKALLEQERARANAAAADSGEAAGSANPDTPVSAGTAILPAAAPDGPATEPAGDSHEATAEPAANEQPESASSPDNSQLESQGDASIQASAPPVILLEQADNLADAIAAAKDEHSRIQQRLGNFNYRQHQQADDTTINITTHRADGEVTSSSHPLHAVSDAIYRASIRMRSGLTLFRVGQQVWQKTIPDLDDASMYLITLDLGTRASPRLLVYNQSYID